MSPDLTPETARKATPLSQGQPTQLWGLAGADDKTADTGLKLGLDSHSYPPCAVVWLDCRTLRSQRYRNPVAVSRNSATHLHPQLLSERLLTIQHLTTGERVHDLVAIMECGDDNCVP